jgi:hypothetical protein
VTQQTREPTKSRSTSGSTTSAASPPPVSKSNKPTLFIDDVVHLDGYAPATLLQALAG